MASNFGKKAIPNHRLRDERKKKYWTQSDVASALYDRCDEDELEEHGIIDGNMVSKWERGLHIPGPFWLRKLCELFGTNAQELGFIEEQISQVQKRFQLSALQQSEQSASPPANTYHTQLLGPNGVPLHLTVHVHQQVIPINTSHEQDDIIGHRGTTFGRVRPSGLSNFI